MNTPRPGNIPPARRCKRSLPKRGGIASMLSMLYLVLISTLAVGFYTATAISAQIAKNERAFELSQSAADGGMQFVRYQLGQITIAPTVQPSGLMDAIAQGLAAQLNGTPNMNGHTIQNSNGVIYIPAANDWTALDPSVGTRFRAIITQSGQFINVAVDGAGPGGKSLRAIQLQYQKAQKAGMILDYGVASRGTVTTSGSSVIEGLTDPTKGSVLSTDLVNSTPVSIGGTVSGDVSVVNASATIALSSGASVGGTSDPNKIQQHLHYGVPAPTFPWIDTSVFAAYATNAYIAGQSTYTNTYIPPNTNPRFTGGTTINGVLYIQTPNIVTFKGSASVNGVIMTDTTGSYDPVNNQIVFGGNLNVSPLSNLDPTVYGGLTKLTGSFLLAPNYAVSMTGNFGKIDGSLLAGTASFSGNAAGTIKGSLITVYDATGSGSASSVYVSGSATVTIASMGTMQYPTGMNFGSNYTPLPGTYLEVAPW